MSVSYSMASPVGTHGASYALPTVSSVSVSVPTSQQPIMSSVAPTRYTTSAAATYSA
eukprot:CAMPEP_0115058814 /NCGR_PEP_ID=MMETSP0227-20121206/6564_1 /TAXON_ID=89957 /ORGANISM="Polarella glacialis, Strain CCMP 1383" /LENGTH=56 /DNA_ID=CAMNT_0002443853 /DNA_START=104 /DNA_END=270 /DNA_ORIENTATION=+